MTIRIRANLPIGNLLFRALMYEKKPNTNYRSRFDSNRWVLASYEKFEYIPGYKIYRRDSGMYRIPTYISDLILSLIEDNL